MRTRSTALIESLESRQLLSASPLVGLAHGELPPAAPHHAPAAAHQHKPHAAPQRRPAPKVQPALEVLDVTPDVTSTAPYGYAPSQIAHAYGFDGVTFQNGTLAGNGKGQTIAVVDAYDDPNIASDLAAFDSQYGLPAMNGKNGNPSFTKLAPSGITADPGWGLEESLDVEWAHAMAPRANIVLVEAGSSGLGSLLSAVDTARSRSGVTVVSMSWGSGEFSGESNYDSHFTTPSGHVPVTFVASAGDSGAPIEWPAAAPNVLSVGGTSLYLNPDNTIASQSGWSGSGGGVSAYETQPAYQNGVVSNWSTTARTGPDVAYAADPNTGFSVYDSFTDNGQSGWFEVGGTSGGAPQWAALVAVADQGRAAAGKASLGGASQTLPKVYSMSATAGNFVDVTTGSSAGSPSYSATAGYDLVTGLGTPHAGPVAQQLVNA